MGDVKLWTLECRTRERKNGKWSEWKSVEPPDRPRTAFIQYPAVDVVQNEKYERRAVEFTRASHSAQPPATVAEKMAKLLEDLVKALDLCEPAINGAFGLAAIHGANYSGPTYGKELDAARVALTEWQRSKEG